MTDQDKIRRLCDTGACLSMGEARRVIAAGKYEQALKKSLNRSKEVSDGCEANTGGRTDSVRE